MICICADLSGYFPLMPFYGYFLLTWIHFSDKYRVFCIHIGLFLFQKLFIDTRKVTKKASIVSTLNMKYYLVV